MSQPTLATGLAALEQQLGKRLIERGRHFEGLIHEGQAILPCSIASAAARLVSGATVPAGQRKTLSVEHPTGEMSCVLELDDAGAVTNAALLRTARKLMEGRAFA